MLEVIGTCCLKFKETVINYLDPELPILVDEIVCKISKLIREFYK